MNQLISAGAIALLLYPQPSIAQSPFQNPEINPFPQQQIIIVEPQSKIHNKIVRALESYVLLETQTKGKCNGVEGTLKNYGVGFVYGNSSGDYLLTLSHVTTVNRCNVAQGSYDITDKEETTRVVAPREINLELIINDTENDLAVFRLPREHGIKKYPFGLGNSDSINLGQEIYAIGIPGLVAPIIRKGIIGSAVIRDKKIAAPNGFFVDITLINGDSGSVIVDADTFQILGVSAQTFFGELGYARPINDYKPYLNRGGK